MTPGLPAAAVRSMVDVMHAGDAFALKLDKKRDDYAAAKPLLDEARSIDRSLAGALRTLDTAMALPKLSLADIDGMRAAFVALQRFASDWSIHLAIARRMGDGVDNSPHTHAQLALDERKMAGCWPREVSDFPALLTSFRDRLSALEPWYADQPVCLVASSSTTRALSWPEQTAKADLPKTALVPVANPAAPMVPAVTSDRAVALVVAAPVHAPLKLREVQTALRMVTPNLVAVMFTEFGAWDEKMRARDRVLRKPVESRTPNEVNQAVREEVAARDTLIRAIVAFRPTSLRVDKQNPAPNAESALAQQVYAIASNAVAVLKTMRPMVNVLRQHAIVKETFAPLDRNYVSVRAAIDAKSAFEIEISRHNDDADYREMKHLGDSVLCLHRDDAKERSFIIESFITVAENLVRRGFDEPVELEALRDAYENDTLFAVNAISLMSAAHRDLERQPSRENHRQRCAEQRITRSRVWLAANLKLGR